MKRVIEVCGFERDVSGWKDITSKLFNSIEYTGLCNWHSNRDRIVADLVIEKKGDVEICDPFLSVDKYFERGSDGRLIAKVPLYIKHLEDSLSGTTICCDGVYLGEGAELLKANIRTIAYVGDAARLINSNVISTNNKKGEASYIGAGVTIEDAHQFCKSVVGSGVENFQAYSASYIHAAINGAIIGGSVGVSDGVGFQSHWTKAEDTRLIDPFDRDKAMIIPFEKRGSTPSLIGSDCRIAGGIQIASPLIVAAGETVGDKKYHAREMFSGMIIDGMHYYVEAVDSIYKVNREAL